MNEKKDSQEKNSDWDFEIDSQKKNGPSAEKEGPPLKKSLFKQSLSKQELALDFESIPKTRSRSDYHDEEDDEEFKNYKQPLGQKTVNIYLYLWNKLLDNLLLICLLFLGIAFVMLFSHL